MDTHSPVNHLNPNVRGLHRSATLQVDAESKDRRARGLPVYRLGLGQSPFPVPTRVVAALREHAAVKDYLPVEGLPELRESVAQYVARHGVERAAADLLVGPGSKELMFLLQLTFHGELVVPTPSWVSYAPQAQIVGRPIRWVPTSAEDGWPMTPEELDRACRDGGDTPRLVILNYPSNPTGQTYRGQRLEELAEVARRHRVLLLSDEIYGELDFSGAHRSIARFYPEGTIISTGLSKWCGAGGWRLGTFVFPPELAWLRESMAAVASETYTSTSAPIQFAAVTAFRVGPDLERYLAGARRVLRALGGRVARDLQSMGAAVAEPEGAFYVFPDFETVRARMEARGIHTSDDLSARLLRETGVAILPGSAFGRAPTELTARLALVDFDGSAALVAEALIESSAELGDGFLRSRCSRVLEAVERLREFLEAA